MASGFFLMSLVDGVLADAGEGHDLGDPSAARDVRGEPEEDPPLPLVEQRYHLADQCPHPVFHAPIVPSRAKEVTSYLSSVPKPKPDGQAMGALATKPACPYAFMRAAMAFAFVLALALISPAVAFAETYAHGHLRYEVADQSVTITGYAGREEIVTVPSMIGGNPVNSIASGAFSKAASVETVYLPNTVVSVEQGLCPKPGSRARRAPERGGGDSRPEQSRRGRDREHRLS